MTGHCFMCHRDIDDVAEHVARYHGQLELWPDGTVVVVDATLEPSDFGTPA